MSSSLDLYAEFTNPSKNGSSADVDLEFIDTYDEARAEAAEALDIPVNDIEFIDVTVYAMDSDLQGLAEDFKWADFLTEDKGMETIKEFLALDTSDQIKALHLFNHLFRHGQCTC